MVASGCATFPTVMYRPTPSSSRVPFTRIVDSAAVKRGWLPTELTTQFSCISRRLLDMDKLLFVKPGVHTNDFAPIYGRCAKKLGHVSLATVFLHGRLTFQPILWENLESPVLRYQPIITAVITGACLNTRWHYGAYTLPK